MLQSFKLAMKSIWSNKMRSFLTMLGIIIGVASVIILVSLVNAYMSYMTDSFSQHGNQPDHSEYDKFIFPLCFRRGKCMSFIASRERYLMKFHRW